MSAKQNRIITLTVQVDNFVIPAGASQIHLYNKGGADATFKGGAVGAKAILGFPSAPTAVALPEGANVSLDYTGREYEAMILNAAGTEVDILCIY